MSDYVGTRDCAAFGCERDNRLTSNDLDAPPEFPHDAVLTRISPKGGSFVGLCQDHIGRSVVLKDEAVRAMGSSTN